MPSTIFWLGWSYFSQGKYNDALTLYQKVVDDYPQDPLSMESQLQLGACLFNQKRYEEAEKVFTKLLENQKISQNLKRDASYQLGYCKFGQKKFEEAIDNYRDFIKSNPEEKELCAELRYKIAEIYYNQNKLKQAIEEYNLLIDEYHDSSLTDDALYWLGRCFLKDNDRGMAIVIFRSLVSMYPASEWAADAQFRISTNLYEEEEYEEAMEEFKKIIKNFSDRKDLAEEANFYIKKCEHKLKK